MPEVLETITLISVILNNLVTHHQSVIAAVCRDKGESRGLTVHHWLLAADSWWTSVLALGWGDAPISDAFVHGYFSCLSTDYRHFCPPVVLFADLLLSLLAGFPPLQLWLGCCKSHAPVLLHTNPSPSLRPIGLESFSKKILLMHGGFFNVG